MAWPTDFSQVWRPETVPRRLPCCFDGLRCLLVSYSASPALAHRKAGVRSKVAGRPSFVAAVTFTRCKRTEPLQPALMLRARVALLLAASLRGARGLAAPRKKLPTRRVDIKCTGCKAPLFRYAKGNGAGSKLVKIYDERIVKDYTEGDKQHCPQCGEQFAREAIVHGACVQGINGKVSMK